METKYKVGDRVQIWLGSWRDAILIEHKHYISRSVNTDGFYYKFDPLPNQDIETGITPSVGGWISVKCIKLR